jgi:DNA polymerase/3'-5' exonuclease PolX
MEISQALAIAERVKAELAPFTERIEIAGSVRRRKPQVKDIELVVIPRRVVSDLFGDETAVAQDFCTVVNRWAKIKGEPTGRYTQRLLPDGINLDLFIVDADTWGLTLAIRTGSADYSAHVLGARWAALGYTSHESVLYRYGRPTYIREEADLFTLLGLPWADPYDREWMPRS